MQTFAVHYLYDDRSALRDAARPAHRSFLAGLAAGGTLLASGPFTGPTLRRATGELEPATREAEPAGALLLLRADRVEDVMTTLDEDPFWVEGLVVDRTARAWNPVIGPWSD